MNRPRGRNAARNYRTSTFESGCEETAAVRSQARASSGARTGQPADDSGRIRRRATPHRSCNGARREGHQQRPRPPHRDRREQRAGVSGEVDPDGQSAGHSQQAERAGNAAPRCSLTPLGSAYGEQLDLHADTAVDCPTPISSSVMRPPDHTRVHRRDTSGDQLKR